MSGGGVEVREQISLSLLYYFPVDISICPPSFSFSIFKNSYLQLPPFKYLNFNVIKEVIY